MWNLSRLKRRLLRVQPIDIVEKVKAVYKNYIKTRSGDRRGLREQMHRRIEEQISSGRAFPLTAAAL